jgi:hypothetical protein
MCSFAQIFEPASYPEDEESLFPWGLSQLDTLLEFYGTVKVDENGNGLSAAPLVTSDECKGEFFTFKREVMQNKGEDRLNSKGNRQWHFFTPPELLEKIFGGSKKINQTLFKGNSSP